MSEPVQITSSEEFNNLLRSSTLVVAHFYTEGCIAPHYAQLSLRLSRPSKLAFAKVNTEIVQAVAQSYHVTASPTFIIFKNQQIIERVKGANLQRLQEAVNKLAAEADGGEGYGAAGGSELWIGGAAPAGYKDVTDQVDVRGLDLLNASSDCGTARALFASGKPLSLDSGKGKDKAIEESEGKDWVESDVDPQLMLFFPFQSTLKVRTIHITSLPPKSSENDDEIPMRPKTIQIYSNRANVLGFDEVEGLPATQSFTLRPQDWDEKTGTAVLSLRFVKFQAVHSLVLFVVEGDGDSESVRIDRVRIFGETGEKRDPGILQKVGEHDH